MRQQFKKFGGFADVLSLRKQELQSNSFPRSEIRVARKLSRLEPKVLLRNFPSVKQIQEESSNAHHRRDDDICYHLFYFECFDSENLLLKFERGASRVRRTFAKRTTFFEAKSVDTFNASDSRQSSSTQLLFMYKK